MKAENKQLNRDCTNKEDIIQSIKDDTSKIISTSLGVINNRIKAMSDLHPTDIVMKD